MDLLTAFVELAKAAAWPVTTLVIIFMLRAQIGTLVTSIRQGSVKYKDLEIAITRELREVEEAIGKRPEARKAEKSSEGRDLLALAQVSPRAAILEAWLEVEIAGASAVKRLGVDDLPRQLRSPVMFGEVLRSRGNIPTEVMKAISKLRDIRNRTAHASEFQPSVDDAEDYVVLASAVSGDLDNVGKNA